MDSAISLVGYPEEVSAAMAYVFGSTLICADDDTAKAVAFDKDIGLYSISADGSTFDPSGSMSGGAAPTGSGILVKAQRIKEVEGQLDARKKLLQDIAREETGGRKTKRETWKRLVRELEIKKHEVKLLEGQVGGSNAAKVRPGRLTLRWDRDV